MHAALKNRHPFLYSRQKSIVHGPLFRAGTTAYSRSSTTTRVRSMSDDPQISASDYEMTRERLARGALMHALRENPPAGLTMRSDTEMDRTLRAVLDRHGSGQDLHVFGYGSLMWNPALDVVDTFVARIDGWHRRFCLRLILGRGTPAQPGAMLALDNGGACNGLLYRIEAAKVEAELRLLWRREMLTGTYDARWVAARARGQKIRALTFVVNRAHDRYIGGHPLEHVAHLIRTGYGPLGTSRAYFDSTVQTLARLGLRDAGIERLRRVIRDADAGRVA
jgi:cation transport protein ChaC